MLKELQDLGLSEKESKIYVAALEIGRATADQLAKHAKVVRPTTYLQIKSLMQKGLMSTYEEGKKTYFAPESPEALRRVLEQQKESVQAREHELERFLPGLTRMYDTAGERPLVRFFEGKDGVTALRALALDTKSKKHDVIYSYEALASLYDENERTEYSETRIQNNIHVRSIISTGDTTIKTMFPLSELVAVHKEELPTQTDMLAYDDKLSIVLFSGKPFGVLIESEGVANSFRAVFNLLWRKLK